MSELIPTLAIIAGFLLVLAVCGILSDYVMPHFHFLDKFYDSLPMSHPETYDHDPTEVMDAIYTPIDDKKN